jgi:hypothetical protein
VPFNDNPIKRVVHCIVPLCTVYLSCLIFIWRKCYINNVVQDTTRKSSWSTPWLEVCVTVYVDSCHLY